MDEYPLFRLYRFWMLGRVYQGEATYFAVGPLQFRLRLG